MRTVLKNMAEACHVWASRSQAAGRAGNVFFERDTIYSYGMHFPIAMFKKMPNGKTVVLFNSEDYSKSTRGHKNLVRQAIPEAQYEIFVLPACDWSKYTNGKAYYLDVIKNYIDMSSRARDNAFYYVQNAYREVNGLKQWSKLHKCKFVYKFTDNDRKIIKRAIEYMRKTAECNALREQKRQEKLKIAMSEMVAACNGDIISYWHKHGKLPYSPDLDISIYDFPTICRIVENEIVTSKGARVPIEHAKRLYPFILRAKRTNTEYRVPPENPICIGYYKLNRISANGDIRIGCHDIAWSEVEYIGKLIGSIK